LFLRPKKNQKIAFIQIFHFSINSIELSAKIFENKQTSLKQK